MAKNIKAINTRLNIINEELEKYENKISKLSLEKTELEKQKEEYEVRELLEEMKKNNISMSEIKNIISSKNNEDNYLEDDINNFENIKQIS